MVRPSSLNASTSSMPNSKPRPSPLLFLLCQGLLLLPPTHASDGITCPFPWPNPNYTSPLPLTSYLVMAGTRAIPSPLNIIIGMKHVTKVASPWLQSGRGGICSWVPSVPSEGRKEKPSSSSISHHGAKGWERALSSPQRPGVWFSTLMPRSVCAVYVSSPSWGLGQINTWH